MFLICVNKDARSHARQEFSIDLLRTKFFKAAREIDLNENIFRSHVVPFVSNFARI